jgi:hypothetical protein
LANGKVPYSVRKSPRSRISSSRGAGQGLKQTVSSSAPSSCQGSDHPNVQSAHPCRNELMRCCLLLVDPYHIPFYVMSTGGGAGFTPTIEPTTDERLDQGESVDHLVCCRGSWDVAACGADTSREPISLIVGDACVMCLEVARRGWRELGVSGGFPSSEPVCYESGRRCPVGDEADFLIGRVLNRPEGL